MGYTVSARDTEMIKSIKHKGIRHFFETGSTVGIQSNHAGKLRIMLTRLNASKGAEDMNPRLEAAPTDRELRRSLGGLCKRKLATHLHL
jgi:plasmid maintenance system killer protein